MRLPVAPVSSGGFRELLDLEGERGPPALVGLSAAERQAISEAAGQVTLADDVAGLLGELRLWLAAEQAYVSDRRWVKVVGLLKVAAACEGRTRLLLWDLWLLPWCVAPDYEGQVAVHDWLLARLGVREALSPARLRRVVEAFEAQAGLEQQADDLDYDASGRLKFSSEVDANVVDAKGAAQVARLKYTRRRRYGDTHINARIRQIDELIQRIAGYAAELGDHRDELVAYVKQSLWLDGDFAQRADINLASTAAGIEELTARAIKVRGDFESLPRLPADPGVMPEPVEHELMSA
jgi:MoxR-like ATPase